MDHFNNYRTFENMFQFPSRSTSILAVQKLFICPIAIKKLFSPPTFTSKDLKMKPLSVLNSQKQWLR